LHGQDTSIKVNHTMKQFYIDQKVSTIYKPVISFIKYQTPHGAIHLDTALWSNTYILNLCLGFQRWKNSRWQKSWSWYL